LFGPVVPVGPNATTARKVRSEKFEFFYGGRRFGRSIADVTASLRILVYSSNSNTRAEVTMAIGKHPDSDLPEFDYIEVATEPMVVHYLDAGGIDLAILDGEASPAGGMGVAKQLKDEIGRCPPLVVLTGRPDDRWLADWSGAEAAVSHPIDPFVLTRAVTALLKN
jgi:DNA-binding response OmpR family regulator